jgi:hypothetical protein
MSLESAESLIFRIKNFPETLAEYNHFNGKSIFLQNAPNAENPIHKKIWRVSASPVALIDEGKKPSRKFRKRRSGKNEDKKYDTNIRYRIGDDNYSGNRADNGFWSNHNFESAPGQTRQRFGWRLASNSTC